MTGSLFPDLVAPVVGGDYTSDDWYTPREIVAWADDVLGGIDTDPAWSPNSHVRPRVVAVDGRKADGLAAEWVGSVWCNPPYSDPEPWIKRCALHPEPALMLIKFDPSTAAWGRWIWPYASAVVVYGRRVKFERPGELPAAAPFPSASVYFGPDPWFEKLKEAPGAGCVLRPPW